MTDSEQSVYWRSYTPRMPSSRLERDAAGNVVGVVVTGDAAGVERGTRLRVLGNAVDDRGFGFVGAPGRTRPGRPTRAKVEPSLLVSCVECSVSFELSSRRARRYAHGEAEPVCPVCRDRDRQAEPPAAAMTAWWKANFSSDELHALSAPFA
jgi:hypothetical protein